MITQNRPLTQSKIARHRIILNLLADKKMIELKQLEKILHCSRITIQRDLIELENKGFIKRIHGGATLTGFELNTYDHEKRLLLHSNKKKIIANKAIRLIKENQLLCFDASSTVYFLTEELFPPLVQIVTTGIDTFLNLQKNKKMRVVLTGGHINRNSKTLVGAEAIDVIRSFYFDSAFFSADAIIKDKGIFDSNENTAQISKTMIEQSAVKILLFDTSKIKNKRGAKICNCTDIDYIVTDDTGCTFLKDLFKERLL
jgi:DeoR/GlpR family transcriptional regulator of sugar metabolism